MRFDLNYFPAYFLAQDMSLASCLHFQPPNTPKLISVDSVDFLDLIDQAAQRSKEDLSQQFHKIHLILHFS